MNTYSIGGGMQQKTTTSSNAHSNKINTENIPSEILIKYIEKLILSDLPEDNKQKIFSELIEKYTIETMLNLTLQIPLSFEFLLKFKELFFSNTSKNIPKKKVQTIGMFYFRIKQGGIEKAMSLIIEHLSPLGYKFVLFTEEPPSPEDFPYPKDMPRYIINPLDFNLFKTAIEIHDIDIFINHQHWDHKYILLNFYMQYLHIPYILFTHSSPFFTDHLYEFLTLNYSTADVLLCLSNSIQKLYSHINPNTIYMLNYLTFDPALCPQSPCNNKNILFLGRIAEEKKPILIIKAMPYILKKHPDTILYIVGSIDYEGSLELQKCLELVNKLNLQNSIIFIEHQKDVSPYFLNSSIHIMPSKNEGMPIVWGEAKAHGVPTIITRMDYLEMNQYKGHMIAEQEDPISLANAIIYLLDNPSYLKQMGQEAKESLQNFTTNNVTERWLSLFTHIEQGTLSTSDLITNSDSIKENTDLFSFYLSTTKQLHDTTKQLHDTTNHLTNHLINNDKWYRFGQLSKKQKIKKIFNILLKKTLSLFTFSNK